MKGNELRRYWSKIIVKHKYYKNLRRKKRKRNSFIIKNESNLVKNKLINLDINFLKQNGFYKNKNIKDYSVCISIPKNFSLQENPDLILKILKKIVAYGLNNKVRKLTLNYSMCEKMSVETSLLMDVIIMDIEKVKKNRKINFEISIIVENNSNIEKMLKNTGLIKHLKFKDNHVKDDSIIKFDLVKGENDTQNSSKISGDVIKFYNTCLGKHGLSLKKEGKDKLGKMIGEVLDNCYNHSGKYKSWYVIGYYTLNNKLDLNIGECSIAIFNFGDTIFEGILKGSNLNLDSMNNLAIKHEPYFLPSRWTKENLFTLYSLQEGVSRMKYENKGKDRGQGTKHLIESFQLLGSSLVEEYKPIMTLTSGCTHIVFDNRYKLTTNNNNNFKVIAFNKENNLSKKPDKKNVMNLKNKFPGVIISMKFYIDRKYITNKMEGK